MTCVSIDHVVLDTIRRTDTTIAYNDLLDELDIPTSTLSRSLARLCRLGLASKRVDPSDRRRRLIKATTSVEHLPTADPRTHAAIVRWLTEST